MRRRLIVLGALLAAGCGGSSSTAPAPVAVPVPTPTPVPTPPPPVATIETRACPSAILGVDLAFYRQLACNAFEQPGNLQPVRRWTVAPSVYLKTVDEAGAPVDAVTLDTVALALLDSAGKWSGGKFGLATIQRGTESREGVSSWITVKWSATAQNGCGNANVALDGGAIDLSYKTPNCGCNGSAIRPRTARHQLGHAMGYWHTGDSADLMSGVPDSRCDQQPSARELAAAIAHYR